jgi:hypothetical protein
LNYFLEKLWQVFCRTKLYFSKRFFRLGFLWWSSWSKVYRRIYHDKYSTVPLATNLSLTQVQHNLSRLNWLPDGLKELWDACGSPRRVQYMLNRLNDGKPQPLGPMDCDDFSIWAAHVIDKNFYPRIFCFAYVDPRDCSIRAHAMCLLRQPDGRIFHLSNWGTSGAFLNLREVCLDVLEKTNSPESVGWCILQKDLSILDIGLELPSGSMY